MSHWHSKLRKDLRSIHTQFQSSKSKTLCKTYHNTLINKNALKGISWGTFAFYFVSGTDFPAYSDTLWTREKCHCNRVSLKSEYRLPLPIPRARGLEKGRYLLYMCDTNSAHDTTSKLNSEFEIFRRKFGISQLIPVNANVLTFPSHAKRGEGRFWLIPVMISVSERIKTIKFPSWASSDSDSGCPFQLKVTQKCHCKQILVYTYSDAFNNKWFGNIAQTVTVTGVTESGEVCS